MFGRNVASYKFALASSLLKLKPAAGSLLKMEDLAVPFANSISEHLKEADKQCTSSSSRFLDACRKFNKQELTEDQLRETTVRFGFANVIDAFHIVGQGEVGVRFFQDERKENNGIRVTDDFSSLISGSQGLNIEPEVGARWNLVETAWELGVSSNLIEYDDETGKLIVDRESRRKSITSCRSALNGYQKGHCFYCFQEIDITVPSLMPDVDHFFPHCLKLAEFKNLDGVWNLVLSCKTCNRGEGGKFERIPSIELLARLEKRNEFLIDSHHPLRETLIAQTGQAKDKRCAFLGNQFTRASGLIGGPTWVSKESAPAVF